MNTVNGAGPYPRLALLALALLVVAVALMGCGRKGAPEAPPGSTYPQEYPKY